MSPSVQGCLVGSQDVSDLLGARKAQLPPPMIGESSVKYAHHGGHVANDISDVLGVVRLRYTDAIGGQMSNALVDVPA